MKQWICLSCPVCARRYTLNKFNASLRPILYPAQVVGGGGYRSGFKVLQYLSWPMLSTLRQTSAWASVIYLYERLGAAYDLYFETLGFLSPKMKMLLQSSYAVAYRPNPLDNYATAYDPVSMSQDIVDSYTKDDISDAYSARLLSAPSWRFES